MSVQAYLSKCLTKLLEVKGQDLFLKVGTVPRARVGGTVTPLPIDAITETQVTQILDEVLNPIQKTLLEKNRSVDFAFSVPGDTGRFRGNVFYQQGVCSFVIRKLWKNLPSFEELYIPTVLQNMAVKNAGIILIGGTVATGKTTTINAMIDYMNQKVKRHIITVEDPVEYLHEDRECIVNQREIGGDANDFNSALKYVVRQSPDVIMIGEMRDADTFNFALSASEVGRLVISTVHAKSVVQIFDRVLGFFRPDQRDAVLNHLSFHVTCFVVQKLLLKKDGKSLIPTFEILVGNSIIKQLIRDRDFSKIPQALRNASQEGMCTMDQSIFKLWEEGEITMEEALGASEKPMELEKQMKGINVSGHGASILGA
jgi:pilus retraction protein PilT